MELIDNVPMVGLGELTRSEANQGNEPRKYNKVNRRNNKRTCRNISAEKMQQNETKRKKEDGKKERKVVGGTNRKDVSKNKSNLQVKKQIKTTSGTSKKH